MSKVSEYVNNMFFTLPQTEEVDRMRWQITESMEDRYAALVSAGYSEEAALGTVVSEYGSMEEICQSLGYQANGPDPYLQVEYEEFRSKYAIGLGAGVAGTLLAAGLSMPIAELLGEPFSIAFFFIVMALSVFDIIYWCIQEDKYKELKKQLKRQQKNAGYTTAPNPPFNGQANKKRTTKQLIRQITQTICALIMPIFTLLFFLLGVFLNAWNPAWILFPAGGILCAIVGIVGSALEKMLDN